MILYRADIFYFVKDPLLDFESSYQYIQDGGLVINKEGYIVEVGEYKHIKETYPLARVVDFTGKLIMPGFIDTHLHFPQLSIIGSFGAQLIDWLQTYTFPVEQRFKDEKYAARCASIFIDELIKNGTTSCMAFATVHEESIEALFRGASSKNMRLIGGNVLMDRNAPKELLLSAEDSLFISEKTIDCWHQKGRNLYAITPRFAITSTDQQLSMAGELHQQYPTTYIQSHISENKEEIAYTSSLFPDCEDYLSVYENAGLLTSRTVFAHGVHLTDNEKKRIAKARAIIAHCPTSNLFLGSGCMNMQSLIEEGVSITLGTDVGAGTSFSMFSTMGAAYKVQQLNKYPMTALEAYYKATLGAAKALQLEDKIGTFATGLEADFIVVDTTVSVLQQQRRDYLESIDAWTIESALFGLQILGDDRNIYQTYIMGVPQKEQ